MLLFNTHNFNIVTWVKDIDEVIHYLEWKPADNCDEAHLQNEAAVNILQIEVLMQEHYRYEIHQG
jgi:hypothetical protein